MYVFIYVCTYVCMYVLKLVGSAFARMLKPPRLSSPGENRKSVLAYGGVMRIRSGFVKTQTASKALLLQYGKTLNYSLPLPGQGD
jgi:hypothetical protein